MLFLLSASRVTGTLRLGAIGSLRSLKLAPRLVCYSFWSSFHSRSRQVISTAMERVDTTTRLSKLRDLMKERNIDVYSKLTLVLVALESKCRLTSSYSIRG
jgi:hypothetical protein